MPRSIEKRASLIKFGILFAVLAYYVATHNLLIYQYVEPFWMFGLFGTTAHVDRRWALLLTATLFVRNLYCRFLCPVGATLGLMSYLTVFRIKRWSECNTCKHVPEDLPVGRDRRAEDPGHRVRALRRLRAALRRHQEVPALAHHRIQRSKKIRILPLQPVR